MEILFNALKAPIMVLMDNTAISLIAVVRKEVVNDTLGDTFCNIILCNDGNK